MRCGYIPTYKQLIPVTHRMCINLFSCSNLTKTTLQNFAYLPSLQMMLQKNSLRNKKINKTGFKNIGVIAQQMPN